MLTTIRLLINKAVSDDKDFFYKLLNTPTWIEHIGDRGIKNTGDAENYITNALIKTYNTNGYGLYLMNLKGEKTPIGICGFVKRDYLDAPDIGFAVLPEFEGKGYTSEAGIALMEYGKTNLGFDKVYGITTEANKASQRVLKKLGLTFLENRKVPNDNEELMVFVAEM